MLCDQQIATSFSVRDILEFDDSDGLIGNGLSPAVAATASGQAVSSLLEPIMLDPADGASDVNTSGYYTNYWQIALQQQHHHPPVVPPANHSEPTHYDYSYNYMSYDCPSAEEFSRFREGEDEAKQVGQRNPSSSSSRPLTTSHHVQQLSHLCPPFTEQEVGCGHSIEMASII